MPDEIVFDAPAAQSPFPNLPWDIVEQIFNFLETMDVVNFASAARINYTIAHGFLWGRPRLSLTQAMLFTRFVYRRPVVTDALPPIMGQIIQKERAQCVKNVHLRLEQEIPEMVGIAQDAVLKRLMNFSPEATYEVHISGRDKRQWTCGLSDAQHAKVRLIVHESKEKAERNAT